MKKLMVLMLAIVLTGCGTSLWATCVGHSALAAHQSADIRISDDGVLTTSAPTRIVFGPVIEGPGWHAQADVMEGGQWVPLRYDERTGEVFTGGRDSHFRPLYYMVVEPRM
jgi:hypothetical protein